MWRIALTSFAQLLIAAVVASLLLGVCDMLALRSAGLRGAWLIHGAPWQRLAGIERLTGYAAVVAEARERTAPYLAGAAVVLAMIIYFWPFAPALARRMFAMSLVQMIMLYTLWPIVIVTNVRIAAVALLVAIYFVIRAEGWITNDLANVIELERPSRRVLLWLVRIIPAAAFLGGLAYRNEYTEGWVAAIALTLLTFFVAIARRPPSRYENLDGVELREAAAATPIFAALLIAAAFVVFGGAPIVAERRVVVIGAESGIVSRFDVRARLSEWWKPRAKIRSRATLW
jgi:hypothetical protein